MKIEKTKPIPAFQTGRPLTYPFDKMEVGDSFAVPLVKHTPAIQTARRIRHAAQSWGKRHGGKRFTVRINCDEGEVRAWRTW